MRTILLILVVLLSAFIAFIVKPANTSMPDLSRYTTNGLRVPLGRCGETVIKVSGYDEKGKEHEAVYAVIAYFKGDDERPFAVMVRNIENPDESPTVYIDLDLDGKFDLKGRAGSKDIGNSVCDRIPKASL